MAPAETVNDPLRQPLAELLSPEPRARRMLRLALCLLSGWIAIVVLDLDSMSWSSWGGREVLASVVILLGTVSIWFATVSKRGPAPIVSENFLAFAHFRPAAITMTLVSFAGAAMLLDDTPTGPSGGTALGYLLGTVSALIMVWLTLFRARKYAYFSRGLSLRAWLALHVYLGLALLLLVPMHAGFRFGWNVHTASFAATVGTVITGLIGVLIYVRIPRLMTLNRMGATLDGLIEQVATLDSNAIRLAALLPDVTARAVLDSIEKTRIGGLWWERLIGAQSARVAYKALRTVSSPEVVLNISDDEREKLAGITEILSEKIKLLERIDLDLRYQGWLIVWLYLHVPLAFATLASVAVHVFLVFYY